jgi:UDPglucose--hexose-1-phosphate uridylyltransferase
MAIRRHPVTGEPIVYAPERAGRPNAFGHWQDIGACPFCPGNESMTPPSIVEIGRPWRIRVFPNKYPAVEGHEVIVDSNRHDATFESLDNAAEVLQVYVDRMRTHADAAYVSLFKNEGEMSGASLPHIHSQIMPLPFVPPRVAREAAAFVRAPNCPLCAIRENVIEENEAFLRFAPSGSSFAYEQWIVPTRHQPQMDGEHLQEMAAILRNTTRATRTIAESMNVLFMNFPPAPAAHFYIQVFPRLASIAGFELATGMFIDIIDPAAAARRLK